MTYRTLIARRTLVQNLFFESILPGRLDSTFPLLMYVPLPPDPFPLNTAKLQTYDAGNRFPNKPRIECVANECDPPKQTSSIFGKASRCRTSWMHNSLQSNLFDQARLFPQPINKGLEELQATTREAKAIRTNAVHVPSLARSDYEEERNGNQGESRKQHR